MKELEECTAICFSCPTPFYMTSDIARNLNSYINLRIYIYYILLGTGCKDTLVICNSIFFIFLSQIKTQRDQKIIVWVQYFPYKYSFKVISND
jgi:hypothetical protein